LRRVLVTASLVLLLGLPQVAAAGTFSSCWVVTEVVPGVGVQQTVTRCRIAGGDVVDYAADTSVPSRLYPNAGTDLNGDCWYLTSAATNWVYISLFVNGDAVLGYDPDPSTPGGIALATGRIRRCTSEPNPATDPAAEVWEYVTSYIHPPPTPELSPEAGFGVTGMITFVGVPVPDPHDAQLAGGGGATLDIHIEVDGVIVDWGDQWVDNFPADHTALAGYPDGAAQHIYEAKQDSGYSITVSYDWTARWRADGGPWTALDVPNTETAVTYPVSEVVSVITG
jgi:hypothetical protein